MQLGSITCSLQPSQPVPPTTSLASPTTHRETEGLDTAPFVGRTTSQQLGIESDKRQVQLQDQVNQQLKEIRRLTEQLQVLDGRIVALQRITMINTVSGPLVVCTLLFYTS